MPVDDADPVATPDRRRADEPAAPRRSWRPALALVLAVAIGLALGPTLSVAVASGATASGTAAADAATAMVDATATTTESSLVVGNATVEPGETATHRIALTEAPTGLAGFELTLELADGTATVANATYPGRYGMTTDPAVGDDRRTVTLEAADLTDEVRPGETDVTLATVAVTGSESGSTTLRVTDAQLDADDGSRIEPALERGAHTVADDGTPPAASEPGDGGTESGGSDTVPGFSVGTAAVAIATLAAVLIVRSR